eukprot:Skav228128  [mRNA]  locus=scaffold1220:335591:343675:+ [translate_table: standard]
MAVRKQAARLPSFTRGPAAEMAEAAGIAACSEVISASELQRIRNAIGATNAADASDVAQCCRQWIKLEIEELERQKVDAEEAKIQLDQRKATIDRILRFVHPLGFDGQPPAVFVHCDVVAVHHIAEAQMSLRGELKKFVAPAAWDGGRFWSWPIHLLQFPGRSLVTSSGNQKLVAPMALPWPPWLELDFPTADGADHPTSEARTNQRGSLPRDGKAEPWRVDNALLAMVSWSLMSS